MADSDNSGTAPETAPLRDAGPAPRDTSPAAPEMSAHEAALSLSDDGFDFDEEDDAPEAQGDPAYDHAERARGQRDERGRFAAQGQQDGEGSEEGEPEEAPNEGDAEPPEGDEPEGDAKPEPAKPEAKAAFVEIDGHKIPVEEVRQGYLRQADYTRKTQAVAEEYRQTQALRQQVESERAELGNILNIAVEVMRARMPAPPDRSLINTDPVSYMRQQAEYTDAAAEVERLLTSQQQLGQQQTAEQQARQREQKAQAEREAQAEQQSRVRAAQALQKTHPHLFTDEGFGKVRAGVEKHSAKLGLTLEDFGQITDPRAFPVIELAVKQLDLEAAKPAALDRVRAAPPIRPGTRQGPGTRSGQANRNAQDAFRRNPTIDGAVDALPDSLFGL